jgi:signal transduction histidine kinase/CheY-like chemotaxis protein
MNTRRLFDNWIYAACFIMMLFFFIGYAANIVFYIFTSKISTQDILIAMIFFFGAIFVLAMITMIRRMFNKIITEEKLIRAKEEAEQGSRQKSEFLSRMSHEIRTPMNAIIGMTSIGISAQGPERKDYCLRKIDSASHHLLGVINDILDMSKIEANKFELSCTNFDLEKMLAKVVNVIGYQVEEKKQHLVLSMDKSVPKIINSDEQRLCQVLTNLLGNAVKFTPDGGTVSLFVRMMTKKGETCMLQFEVKDTGIGISKEHQEKLFNPFEQADGSISRKFGGTGLGLAISKQIVEMLEGVIRVESAVGIGTSFIFDIRANIPKPDRINESSAALNNDDDAGVSKEFDLTGKKVLIAEDIEINREIIRILLEQTGLIIDFAENGREAFDMFAANPSAYNMIFMDIHMPEVDGYSATEMIRKFDNPCAQTIPIIAMTADVFREDIEKCLKMGMNDHVGKPLNIDEVKAKLAQYCRAPLKTPTSALRSFGKMLISLM